MKRYKIPDNFQFTKKWFMEQSQELMSHIYENLPQGGILTIPRPKNMAETSFESLIEFSCYYTRNKYQTDRNSCIGMIKKNDFVIDVYFPLTFE